MPLAISLLAHLVDLKGCSHVLSLWEEERTSLISTGYDRRDNLDLSISLSLTSPRIKDFPHSQDLLALLSILPDGLSVVELQQSKLPLNDVLGCRAALIRTALAYSDEHQRLKVLSPIREYMHRVQPPGEHLIQPLLRHFKELLEFYIEYRGTQSGLYTVGRISSNYSNIQNILMNGLQKNHPDLVNSIYCACHLNTFSLLTGRGKTDVMDQIHNILPRPCEHRLEAYFITELLISWKYHPISNPETVIAQALQHFDHFNDDNLKCEFPHELCFSKLTSISSQIL
jgi:hypothetical protein